MNPFFRVSRFVVAMLAAASFLLPMEHSLAQAPVLLPNTMSTAAGNVHALDFGGTATFGFTADGTAAIGATLNYPQFVGVDPKGEVYFQDAWSAVIRQIDDAGNLRTVAGTVPAAGCTAAQTSSYNTADCWNGGTSTTGGVTTYGNAAHNVPGVAATSSGFGMGYAAEKVPGPTFDSYGNMYIAEAQGYYGVDVVYRGGAALSAFLATLYPTQTITPGNAYLLVGSSSASYTANGTAAVSARLKAPGAVGVDSEGNVYIPDENGFVQVLNIQTSAIVVAGVSIPAGSVSTILGENCVAGTGCTAVNPTNNALVSASTNGISDPDAVTVDRWGNIYIANKSTGSTGTAMVAVIYAGAPNAVVGSANPLYGMLNAIYPSLGAPTQNFTYILSGASTGGTAVSTSTTWQIGALNTGLGGSSSGLALGNVQGIAVDTAGNVYFTDTSKLYVYRIDAVNGETAIVAGGGSKYSIASATYPKTQECEANTANSNSFPIYSSSNIGDGCETIGIVVVGGNYGVALDQAGDLYFTQGTANVLDKLSIGTDFPTTAVGSTSAAQRIRVHFYASNLYAATNAFTISGISSTEFAFSGATPTPSNVCSKYATDGSYDCVVTVTFKPAGTGLRSAELVVTDVNGVTHNFPLNGLATGPQVTFDAGVGANIQTGMNAAAGVAVDGMGTVYATDSAANALYRTKPGGTAAAFAATALFSAPHQVAVDTAGNVYVADSGNNRIALVTPQGTASALALQMAALSPATLAAPQGVAVDRVGNVYIADTGNARILMQPADAAYATRAVSTGGVTLSKPTSLAVDTAGNLYVVDTGLDEVIEFPQAQQGLNYVEATPAGPTPVIYKSGSLTAPQGVVVDPAGSVYVSDSVANTVYVFTAGQTSMATALIATGLSAPASSLSGPSGLALDTASNLYVADTGNGRVFEEYRGAQTLAMGQVGIGTTSPMYPVEVGSYGTVATTLTGFAISSPFTSVNTGSSQCMSTTQLGVGGYCSAEVDYTPGSTAGAMSGTLTATDNAQSSPQTIALTATAVVQQSQTITWTLASPVTYGVAPITLGGTASSGLTLTYAITSGSQYGSIKGNVLTVTGAGTIVIQASQAGAPAYKAATPVSQTLVVNKAALTFTATSVSGGTGVIPLLTYTSSGYVNGDTQASATTGAPSETTTATTSSPAGTYPITLSVGTLTAANYTFSFASGTLTLQGTGQTISFTALPASVTYGAAPLTLSATASSGLAVSFSVTGPATLSGTTLTITGAGTVVVTANQGGSTPVYQPYAPAQAVSQTITVNPAPLTITANSFSRQYGMPNPSFTGTISGAVNGDAFMEMFGTSATTSSNVGTYTITPSVLGLGAANTANYTIKAVTGTLTVTQATDSIGLTVTPASPLPTGGTATLTATLTIQGGTPTGTFTFYANGTSIGTSTYTVSGTTVTATKAFATNSASESFTVTYANDTNLASATSNAVVVSVMSATTVGLTSTNMTPGTGQAFTLQATVAATLAGATAPTGTVTFVGVQNGVTATLGTAAVNSAGLASLSVTYNTVGVLALSANYSGDTLHATSVGTIIQISNSSNMIDNVVPVVVGTPTFEISLTAINYGLNIFETTAAPYTPPALPVACTSIPTGTLSANDKFYAVPYCLTPSNAVTATAGLVIQQQIAIQSYFGLADNVTMSCSGLPQYASCLFSPPVTPLAPTASGQQVLVSIDTTHVIVGENRGPFERRNDVAWATLLLGSLGLLGAARRFRRSAMGRLLTAIAVLALGASSLGISGCASPNSSAKAAVGVYPIVITATDGTVVQTVTVNLTLQ